MALRLSSARYSLEPETFRIDSACSRTRLTKFCPLWNTVSECPSYILDISFLNKNTIQVVRSNPDPWKKFFWVSPMAKLVEPINPNHVTKHSWNRVNAVLINILVWIYKTALTSPFSSLRISRFYYTTIYQSSLAFLLRWTRCGLKLDGLVLYP